MANEPIVMVDAHRMDISDGVFVIYFMAKFEGASTGITLVKNFPSGELAVQTLPHFTDISKILQLLEALRVNETSLVYKASQR